MALQACYAAFTPPQKPPLVRLEALKCNVPSTAAGQPKHILGRDLPVILETELAMSLGNHAKQFAVSIFMFLFICALPAAAQTGTGLLSGWVVDSQGGALQGAKVEVNPGAASTLSDAQGQFTLNGVSAGDHDVTVSYAGFASFTKKVTVVSGQVVRLAASLTVASNKQDVQVYAGREGGEIEAMNRTFNADNIINVLPADVIKSLPNANVADALGRLSSVTLERDEGEGKYVQVRGTEPRLTNVTIDGVNIASAETVRQIKLDIIPADLVESVQINKTLEASMPGDGIGGRSTCARRVRGNDRPWRWSRPEGTLRSSGAARHTSSMAR
jgi:hypothetical protein